MIQEIYMENFRCFRRFKMGSLGRINLLVGTNNSGKTSVLEAIQLLSSHGDPRAIWSVTNRRGERTWEEGDRPKSEADISHLFNGHDRELGAQFVIKCSDDDWQTSLTATVMKYDDDEQGSLFDEDTSGTGSFSDGDAQDIGPTLLELEWSGRLETQIAVPISVRGGLAMEDLRRFPRRMDDRRSNPLFITTAALSPSEIVTLFDEIVLTPEEDFVTDALRTIEPRIERLATAVSESRRIYGSDRGGIVVKCRNIKQRIPIGSMGDGIWRLLGLSLALVRAENGILLVDEIDTGLHYSVMSNMWTLLKETAERLNVQVFATTHSRDCYESLAAISRDNNVGSNRVSLQRIERNEEHAIAFTEQEIVIAANRGIEVR